MLSHKLSRLFSLVAGLVMLLSAQPAFAGYFSLLHDTTDTNGSNGSAFAVAMPSSDNGSIQITRIRVSGTNSTALDFLFRSERNTLSVGQTKSMSGWTCTLPGCGGVYAIDGQKAGELYDMDGLEIDLPPGHRLFFYTSADIGSDFMSVEVWWREL